MLKKNTKRGHCHLLVSISASTRSRESPYTHLPNRRGFRSLRPAAESWFAVVKADPKRVGFGVSGDVTSRHPYVLVPFLSCLQFRPDLATGPKLLPLDFAPQLHPLVLPQVSHFSHVPFRTIVKFWHSVHMLPV